MYSPELSQAVEDFCKLYGTAEAAYKRLQTLLLQIDDKIHNEFRYCARALREFAADLPEGSEAKSLDALQRASHAAKNALNDSVDLVIGYARLKINEFSSIDCGRELVLFIPNLSGIEQALSGVHATIANSRAMVNGRVDTYVGILDSDEFKTVLAFCESIPTITNNINIEYRRVREQRKKFTMKLAMFVTTTALSIVAIVQGMPEFIKWLSKFFPSLSWLV